MHSYLRAIGFSDIYTRPELNKILSKVRKNPTNIYNYDIDDDLKFAEISMEFAKGIGITIRGEYDRSNRFYMEHYFPYIHSDKISSKEEASIIKKVDYEAYTGMCDDFRLGVSLIFYIQNSLEQKEMILKGNLPSKKGKIYLSALSLKGKILLPMENTDYQKKNKKAEAKYRHNLISEAKKGNQDAIDNLTIDDIDTYAMVSRRIQYEDVYSIVDTSFIPYGSESDNYSIIGIIKRIEIITNIHTKELIYDMDLLCNGVAIRLCINKDDLIGEAKIGRRFKGNVWLQGSIKYN